MFTIRGTTGQNVATSILWLSLKSISRCRFDSRIPLTLFGRASLRPESTFSCAQFEQNLNYYCWYFSTRAKINFTLIIRIWFTFLSIYQWQISKRIIYFFTLPISGFQTADNSSQRCVALSALSLSLSLLWPAQWLRSLFLPAVHVYWFIYNLQLFNNKKILICMQCGPLSTEVLNKHTQTRFVFAFVFSAQSYKQRHHVNKIENVHDWHCLCYCLSLLYYTKFFLAQTHFFSCICDT